MNLFCKIGWHRWEKRQEYTQKDVISRKDNKHWVEGFFVSIRICQSCFKKEKKNWMSQFYNDKWVMADRLGSPLTKDELRDLKLKKLLR